jgi:BASS family bile acid:Na+ symporter
MDDLLLTAIRLGLTGSVFALTLAYALPFSRDHLARIPRERGELLRALVAIDVAVPLVTLVVVLLTRPGTATVIGLAILAASPAAPLAVGSALKAGGRPRFVRSFHLTAALLAPITAPITLALLGRALGFDRVVHSAALLREIAIAVFLPTCLGVAIRVWWPALAERIAGPLTRMGGVVLLAVLGLVVARSFQAVIAFGPRSYLAVILMIAGALAAGQLLGPSRREDRTALALECAARNPGLALLIAAFNFPSDAALPVLIPYLLAAGLVSSLYARWRARGERVRGTTGDPADPVVVGNPGPDSGRGEAKV